MAYMPYIPKVTSAAANQQYHPTGNGWASGPAPKGQLQPSGNGWVPSPGPAPAPAPAPAGPTAAQIQQWNAAVAANQAAAAQAQQPQAAPAASSPGQPAPTPFLTPDQQNALDKSNIAWQTGKINDQARLTQAPADELAAEAKSNYAAAVSTANSNAMMAARGMMGSGISASSIADINLTLNNNLMTLRTNLGNLTTQLNGNLATLDANHNSDLAMANGEMTQNALTGDNTTGGSSSDGSTGGAPPAAPAAPAAAPASVNAVAKPPPAPRGGQPIWGGTGTYTNSFGAAPRSPANPVNAASSAWKNTSWGGAGPGPAKGW